MDKIILKKEDIDFLLQWRDEHKDYVRKALCPLKAVKILCVDSGFILTAVREGDVVSISVTNSGKSFGKLVFDIEENGMCFLKKDTSNFSSENRQSVLTVYFSATAFLVFGNSDISLDVSEKVLGKSNLSKKTRKRSKNNGHGFTYILHKDKKGVSKFKIQGSHSSPNCSFSVRGHFRHYKNGKVIWISEYRKGQGKNKDKSYKIGNKEIANV